MSGTSDSGFSVAAAARPYVCGGTAAMFAASCIHPIDLTKTRLQLWTKGEGAAAARPSAFTVASTILKEEGVQGLYAGWSASMMRQAVYGTARLGLHRSFSNMLKERRGGENLPLYEKIASSLASGAIASAIGNPFDVSMVRMQSDTMLPKAERRGYKNVFDALIRIAREEGVFRLWRGSAPTIVRAMAMNMGMMASYDQTKEIITAINGDNFSTQLMSSATAGFFAAFISLPFDMMKSRLQSMRPDANGNFPYKGVVDCGLKIFKNEGLLTFWRGFLTYYGRTAPHAMIILLTLERFKVAYNSVFGLKDE